MILAIAAGVTSKIKLGTAVCIAVEHHSITLAKTVASLDLVSGGRVLLGLGAGWNREEMENLGTNYDSRFRKLEQQMQALTEIWTNDEATFKGDFESFERICSWPKPIQKPRPPLLIGGRTEYSLRRLVKFGDGWIPDFQDVEQYRQGIDRIHELAMEQDRDPASISVTAYAAPSTMIEQLKDLPVERAVLILPGGDEKDTLTHLDNLAQLHIR